MVKKLLKHECIYYFRTFSLFLPIVLVIGVMARVFRFLENDNAPPEINVVVENAIFSSTTMLLVSCAALLVLATVIGIVRFYKNMYSAEGYLTFTLPVTNAQHIFVKLLVATVWQMLCFLTVIAAGSIALAGDDSLGVLELLDWGIEGVLEMCGTGHVIAYIVELILLAILSVVANMLLYYACITVGQLAKKNRILLAIGAYFIYYIASQVITTVVTIVVTVAGMTSNLADIVNWVIRHYVASIHIYLVGAIILTAVMAAVFWLVTQTIMTKKLNLE